MRDELRLVLAHRSEVEEQQAAGLRLHQVVGEVRVGLDEAELEDLAEEKPLEQNADRVARLLKRGKTIGRACP